MAERQTHRQVPHELTHSSSLPLSRATASKRKGHRLGKRLLYSWSLNEVITVTIVKTYLLGSRLLTGREQMSCASPLQVAQEGPKEPEARK